MAPLQARLIVLKGPEDPGPFVLPPDTIQVTLGSDPVASAIVLPGPGVAGVHCTLIFDTRKWWITPMTGAEVHVEGRAITETSEVQDVSVIQIGPYRIQFLLEEVEPLQPGFPRRTRRHGDVLQVAPPATKNPRAGAEAAPAPPAPDAVEAGAPPVAPFVLAPASSARPAREKWGQSPFSSPKHGDRPHFSSPMATVGKFIRSPTGWLAIGASVAAVAVLAVVISLYVRRGQGRPKSDSPEPEPRLVQALPPQAGELLDVVVRGGIARELIETAGDARPGEAKLTKGQVLTVKIDQAPRKLKATRDWRGTLRWEGVVPKLAGNLDGLAVEVVEAMSLGAKTLPAGTLLVHRDGGWHIAEPAPER